MESAGINIWSTTEDKNFPTPRVCQSSIVQQRGVKSHEPLRVHYWWPDRPHLVHATQLLWDRIWIAESRPGDRLCSLSFFLDSYIPSTPTQQCPVSLTGGLDVLFRTEHWTAIYSLKSHESAPTAVHYEEQLLWAWEYSLDMVITKCKYLDGS